MELTKQPLLTAGQIQKKVEELAQQISADYAARTRAGRDLLLIAVLKGGLIFASDLMRRLTVPSTVDFIRAQSYCHTHSKGACDLLVTPQQPVTSHHVLVVEDIIDTGITVRRIVDYLAAQNPASLEVCTLLDKPARRKIHVQPRYVGFTIDNEFVVGYGMDFREQGRHLPDIYVMLDH